jgi:hypothetical protein
MLVMKIGQLTIATELADTTFKKFRGLMLRRKLDKALVFLLDRETKIGAAIHSYFVIFSFDIIWLSKDRRVVDMRTVRPFRLIEMPREKAKYFIELPKGSIKKAGVKIGQKINLD